MPKTKKQLTGAFLAISVFLAGIIFLGIVFVTWKLWQSGSEVHAFRSAQMQDLMQGNPAFFDTVFEEILTASDDCTLSETECTQQARSQFDALTLSTATLSSTVQKPNYFSSISLRSDEPFYFIALNKEQTQITKLFFSGERKDSPLITRKEKRVAQLLLGKKERLMGLQANVEGLRMTYLNDLYSEAEIIVPYKKDGTILGAVVYLHGD